jgi:Mce-associated membrane protein
VTAPSPSWYDLLGVDQDASAEDVRTAWKTGIADLDPTDRRFRLLNQAAEVLLDPEQRAAYDEARRDERSEAAEPGGGGGGPARPAPRGSRPGGGRGGRAATVTRPRKRRWDATPTGQSQHRLTWSRDRR